MKIAYKLILSMALPVALIWAVGYYAITAGQHSLRGAIVNASQARAAAVIDEIDHVMHAHIIEWLAYAHSPLTTRALRASNEQFDRLEDVEGYLTEQDKLWCDAEGDPQLLKQLTDNELAHEMLIYLTKHTQAYGFNIFGEVFITNRYGANIAQTGRTSDYRQDDEFWWQQAKRSGLFIGDVSFDQSAGAYSTAICVRVDDKNGEFLGVLKAVLDIQEAIGIIDRRAAVPTAGPKPTLVLFDADHRIIHTGNQLHKPLRDGSKYFESTGAINQDRLSQTVDREDASTKQKYLASYALSQGYGPFAGLGWIVLLEYPLKAVMQPAQELRRHVFLVASGASVVALLLTGVIAIPLSRSISQLATATVELGQGNLDTTVNMRGDDEIAHLASSFNHMVKQLKQAEVDRLAIQKQLMEATHAAGKAQVATGVLHNVGNILNSVNTSVDQVKSKAKALPIQDLHDAAALISRNADDLGKFVTESECGRLLPIFLQELGDHLADQQRAIIDEAASLSRGVEHINQVVASQQEYASSNILAEQVLISQLVEDAVSINAASLSDHKIPVELDVNSQLKITTNRHLLLQVLVNLISNAIHALQEQSPAQPQLVINAQPKGDDGIRITVCDNGKGIASENLTRIFHHGFTTRKDGHGFGLHSAANAAKELGGNIMVHSEGPGCGSLFTLELPLQHHRTTEQVA